MEYRPGVREELARLKKGRDDLHLRRVSEALPPVWRSIRLLSSPKSSLLQKTERVTRKHQNGRNGHPIYPRWFRAATAFDREVYDKPISITPETAR